MKILTVGGGSGGHVTPVAAVIEQIFVKEKNLVVRFVCDKKFELQSKGIMSHVSVPVTVSTINAGKFRRYAHLSFIEHFKYWHILKGNIVDIFNVVIGFFQSLWLLIWFRPQIVFAKGGYVCLPMGLAAWCLRIPLVIHDSDSRPGLTNRILSRFATQICTGFELSNYSYNPKKSHYVGVPIANQYQLVTSKIQNNEKTKLKFSQDEKLILAFGGGLGALSINDIAPKIAKKFRNVTVFNIAGNQHINRAKDKGRGVKNYLAVPFIENGLYPIMAAADLVITRSSATVLQEIAGLGKPSILIPAHQLHDQIRNAKIFEEAGAAIIIDNKEIINNDLKNLFDAINKLLFDKVESNKLAKAVHKFARKNAAKDVADIILKTVKK